jgi:3D (Asp-Asp-Asp) domain-containing protein
MVLINGKEYVAQDCGGAIKGNKIDIFVDNPKMQKYTVEIYIKREE